MVKCTCKVNGCVDAEVALRTARQHERIDKLTAKREKYRVGRPVQQPPLHEDEPAVENDTLPPRPISPLDIDMTNLSTIPTTPEVLPTLEQLGQIHELHVAASQPMPETALESDDEDDGEDEEEEATGRDGHAPPGHPTVVPMEDDFRLRDAPKFDPRFLNENIVDPFYEPQSLRMRNRITLQSTPRPLFLLYLLVAWLHTQCKVAFKACNVVLIVVLNILASAGAVEHPNSKTAYVTLTSVLNNTGAEPDFQILSVCPSCQEPYPASREGPFSCDRCHTPVLVETQAASPGVPQVCKAALQCPHLSIETQLRAILAVPGMIQAMDHWRSLPRQAGLYNDMFDGFIPQNVKGPGGTPFFAPPCPPEVRELRIGLVLGFDWFSYLRSMISASHSSGPLSFNIPNLPHHLRYRLSNMLLTMILPGPKEQDADQVQRYMRIIVNKLIHLWEHGFWIETDLVPEGRLLVRVLLLCICCDKPAAHKLGGFGAHSHTYFCTRCCVKQKDKGTREAYTRNAFTPRTHDSQLEEGLEYAEAGKKSAKAAADYAKEHATRWTELLRLPYFNVCRMIIIDPMHALLLGLVKNHFYNIWIILRVLRKTKEILVLHGILSKLKVPSYLGRLPALMGTSAGGSLTADQWLIAAIAVLPVAVPQIWANCTRSTVHADVIRLKRFELFAKLRNAKQATKAKAKQSKKKKKNQPTTATHITTYSTLFERPEGAPRGTRSSTRPRKPSPWTLVVNKLEEGEEPIPDDGQYEDDDDAYPDPSQEDPINEHLHPDDPDNFFKLSHFIKLVLAHSLTSADVNKAEELIRSYCIQLIELYGPEVMKPNHHYATYIPDCIRDFGPLVGFWTFVFERLNKVLKSFNSGNHSGGELEVSFFREYHRTILTGRLMETALAVNDGNLTSSVNSMLSATNDDRGTVRALVQDIEEAYAETGIKYCFSPKFSLGFSSPELYDALVSHVQLLAPTVPYKSHLVAGPGVAVPCQTVFYEWLIVGGRRYYTDAKVSNAQNAMVAIRDGHSYSIGRLKHITAIELGLPHLPIVACAAVQLALPVHEPLPEDSHWNSRTGNRVWEHDKLASRLAIINPEDIISHIMLTEANVEGDTRWVSVVINHNQNVY